MAALLGFKELFGRSVALLHKHIWTVLLLILIPTGVMMVGQLLLALFGGAVEPSAGVAPSIPVWPLVVFGIFTLVSMGLWLIVNGALWVLAMEGKGTVGDLFTKGKRVALPLLGVYFWTFVRTYGWLLLIGVLLMSMGAAMQQSVMTLVGGLALVAGVIVSIVLWPRYILAPVIYLKGGKGTKQSVDASYPATEGYVGKIYVNWILFVLCLILISIVLGLVTSMAQMIIAGVGTAAGTDQRTLGYLLLVLLLPVTAFTQAVSSGLSLFFLKEMAVNILANPKKAGAKR